VCWDQWYPEGARLMALAGAELLLYPTAIGWDPSDARDEKERQREAWITVQLLKHLVGQVLQARTTIDQQNLRGDRAQSQ